MRLYFDHLKIEEIISGVNKNFAMVGYVLDNWEA